MSLKEIINHMHKLLTEIAHDLTKAAVKGNKAASQRVRTATIKLAKIAKEYRKESIFAERKGKKKAAPKAKAKKAKKTVSKKSKGRKK